MAGLAQRRVSWRAVADARRPGGGQADQAGWGYYRTGRRRRDSSGRPSLVEPSGAGHPPRQLSSAEIVEFEAFRAVSGLGDCLSGSTARESRRGRLRCSSVPVRVMVRRLGGRRVNGGATLPGLDCYLAALALGEQDGRRGRRASAECAPVVDDLWIILVSGG